MMQKINEYVSKLSNSKIGLTLVGATAGLALLVSNAMADVSGKVYEGKLNAGALQPIQNALVIIRDGDNSTIQQTRTNEDGFYQFNGDFDGYRLEVVDSAHWSAIKENLVNDVECYVILPQRVGDLTEQKSLGILAGWDNGPALMYHRTLGQPMAVFFDNSKTPWSTVRDGKTEKQWMEEYMANREAMFGKDLWEEVFTKRSQYDPSLYGKNLVLDYDGYDHNQSYINYEDQFNIFTKMTTVFLNDTWITQHIDKEMIAMPHHLAIPNYIPTCIRSPSDVVSAKDVMYFNPIDDFRPVFLKIRAEHPGTQLTSMLELTAEETPVATENTSWGSIKALYK